MANLKEWILAEADGEKIEAVLIGKMGWGDYRKKDVPGYDDMPKGELLTWEEAEGWLDYDFDDGFGSPSCNAVWAWTENKVIAIGQYDGATWAYYIPRNPVDNIMPSMEGGG